MMQTQRTRVSKVVSDYVALTKPRIIFLLLVTAVGSMFLAAEGRPDPLVIALVVVSGYLAAGGANALNHGTERDIDQRWSVPALARLPAEGFRSGRPTVSESFSTWAPS